MRSLVMLAFHTLESWLSGEKRAAVLRYRSQFCARNTLSMTTFIRPCFCEDMEVERPAKRLWSLRKRHDPSLSSLLEDRLLAGAARAVGVEVERDAASSFRCAEKVI